MLDYETCKHLVYRKQRKEQAPVRDIRNFVHGTLADRAMRRWLEQDTPQLRGQMDKYIDDSWNDITNSETEKVKWRGNVRDDQERVLTLAKLTVNNLEPFLEKYVIPYEYQPELRFKVPFTIPDQEDNPRTVILNGGMDIVVRNPRTGQIAIYDLKSTLNESYVSGKILAQLIFYQLSWHLLEGTDYDKIDTAFVTPATRVMFHPLTITQRDRMMLASRIMAFARGAWQNDFAPRKDDTYCGYCVCREWCSKFQQDVKTGKDGKRRVSLLDTANARGAVELDDKRKSVSEGAGTTGTSGTV